MSATSLVSPERRARLQWLAALAGRYAGKVVIALVIGLILGWFGWKGSQDARLWLVIFQNAIALAGLYFLTASGFTLIFGLMRVVNMAHGSLFLLGGYIAYEFEEVIGNFGVPLLLAVIFVVVLGLIIQQAFLRWNQGQELRQALITIAISIILADQMLREFGGVAREPVRPGVLDFTINLPVFDGLRYNFTRYFIVICAIAVGVGLYLWLHRTRTGMIIRAGVDDRQMVSALGINIQLVFAIAFGVGAALAAFAGVLNGFVGSLQPGVDTQFLLNALIVVIIGGMGSLVGAAVGALVLAFVDSYADAYLVIGGWDGTNYSILLTFLLMVFVLAVRPYGLFGRPA